jgi:hypothetical protein
MPIADLTIDIHKDRRGRQDALAWTARNKSKPNAHDAAVMGHALEVLLGGVRRTRPAGDRTRSLGGTVAGTQTFVPCRRGFSRAARRDRLQF